MSPRTKKTITVILVVFAIYAVYSDPNGSADSVEGVFSALQTAFGSVTDFFDRLLSG